MPQPSTTGPADTTNTDPDQQEHEASEQEAEGTEGEAGEGEGESDPDANSATTSESDEGNEDGLPENVKAILKKNREAAKKAEQERKAEAKRAKNVEQQLARYRDKHGELPNEEPDPVAEATAKANQRILKAEVRAAAKGKFRDVSDAFANLDLSEFEVSDDGEVDADAIEAALDDILERKAYLGAEPAPKAKRFEGSADQGTGTAESTTDRQWTQADVEKATQDQLIEADRKGLLTNLKKGN